MRHNSINIGSFTKKSSWVHTANSAKRCLAQASHDIGQSQITQDASCIGILHWELISAYKSLQETFSHQILPLTVQITPQGTFGNKNFVDEKSPLTTIAKSESKCVYRTGQPKILMEYRIKKAIKSHMWDILSYHMLVHYIDWNKNNSCHCFVLKSLHNCVYRLIYCVLLKPHIQPML